MDSRRRILDALRAASPPAPGAPDLSGVGVRFDDPVAQLADAIAAVAGRLVRVPDRARLADAVAALAAELGAARVASTVAGVPGDVDLGQVTDAHALDGVGLAVVPGAFAVAENGAVWVPGETLRPRGIFVVAEHLALVVPAGEIVHDMHEAYRRLSFPGPAFGTFIAGPSKTADIEQALVIGAHGARSCTVLLAGA
ncbi:MAG TPA: LUD domain-containing protein [Anaeromyxobacter sp.]|nr:LUD domain-containing protein [Anaeromyxobacter sp.]